MRRHRLLIMKKETRRNFISSDLTECRSLIMPFSLFHVRIRNYLGKLKYKT